MRVKIKLVIADSDDGEGRQLAEYLDQQGDVEVAKICRNGYSTLNAVKELKPDMLLLDLILPGMDGIAVLEDVKALEYAPSVIVTSALDNSRMINCACALGADFYICKPYELHNVHERIVQIGGKQNYSLQNLETGNRMNVSESVLCRSSRYSMEAKVTNTIRTLGIPAHIKGYQYIREGVLLALNDENMLAYITKYLYPTIAKKYNTTSSSVERAIRHAIGVAWERGNSSAIAEIYGCEYMEERRPTNSEFLSVLVDKFQLEEKLTQKDYIEVAKAM